MGYFWNGTSGEFLKEEGLNLGPIIGIFQVSTKQNELENLKTKRDLLLHVKINHQRKNHRCKCRKVLQALSA